MKCPICTHLDLKKKEVNVPMVMPATYAEKHPELVDKICKPVTILCCSLCGFSFRLNIDEYVKE